MTLKAGGVILYVTDQINYVNRAWKKAFISLTIAIKEADQRSAQASGSDTGRAESVALTLLVVGKVPTGCP